MTKLGCILVFVTIQSALIAATSAAAGVATNQASPITNILGSLVNNIACRSTSNFGRTGQCLPRSCCSVDLSVERLCIDGSHTCCYGQDLCRDKEIYGHNGHNHHYEDGHHRPIDTHRPGIVHRPSLSNSVGSSCNNFVRRREWNARGSKKTPDRFREQLSAVIVHHSEDGPPCYDFTACGERVYEMQDYYQRRKDFPDIPWNFLISDSGDVIEGMGWHFEGYHTENWNYRSLGVAFIGEFEERLPSRRAIEAFEMLVECGARHGALDPYFGIYGHRDMKNTDCPGEALYDYLRGLRAFKGSALPKTDLVSRAEANATTSVEAVNSTIEV